MASAQPYSPIAGALLKGYKATFSVVCKTCGIECRHAPTCSEYAAECVSRHGLWAGSWMTLARLSRCRPGGSHGWDPAPQTLPEGLTSTGARWYAPWRYGDWVGDRSGSVRL